MRKRKSYWAERKKGHEEVGREPDFLVALISGSGRGSPCFFGSAPIFVEITVDVNVSFERDRIRIDDLLDSQRRFDSLLRFLTPAQPRRGGEAR